MTAGVGSDGLKGLFFRQASLPLSLAVLIVVGFLLLFLGLLLFPVNLGLIPFSPDGQLGLLLVITSIQMMALGETPLGQFKRSWLMVIIGIFFASMGIVSCTVPGILTDLIRILLGALNIIGGVILLGKMYLSSIRPDPDQSAVPESLQPIMRKMQKTQKILYIVSIAFGITMLLPGIVSGFIIALILVINGGLLFRLGSIIYHFQ